MTTPYTYYLKHKPTGKKYYGVRYKKNCHPSDLWNKYFSSSLKVKKLIEEYGIDSFEYKIRKVFDSTEKARKWESKVLWRLRVVRKSDWLNESYGKSVPTMEGKPMPEERKLKISMAQRGKLNHMWGKTHSEEVRKKISLGNQGKKHTDETKLKLKQFAVGRKLPTLTEEQSKSRHARSVATNKNRAHKRTEEQKLRMKKAALGRKWKICPKTGKRVFYREIHNAI